MIQATVDNYELQLHEKEGQIQLMLNAKNDLISADEVHFSNLISNLIDNAIKYSKEKLKIIVSTHSTKNNLVIRIEDNGIGDEQGICETHLRKILPRPYGQPPQRKRFRARHELRKRP
jgi:K+-sensing histidine kinase KdpD